MDAVIIILCLATLTLCVYTFSRLYIMSKELEKIRSLIEFQIDLVRYSASSPPAVKSELYVFPQVHDLYQN